MKRINKLKIIITSLLIAGSAVFSQTYSYDDLYSLMLVKNPEFMSLNEEYQRSLLDEKDAWAGLGPTVDLQVSGTYMANPQIGPIYLNVDDVLNSIQWPTGIKPAGNGQYVKLYEGMENTLYNFQLSITQPIFTWGKIKNAIVLYKQIAEIKRTQIESKKQQLETELKTRMATLYCLNNINNIIEEEKQLVERLVKISEVAEKSGMLLHQDVVDAKIQAKELEIAQRDLQEQMNLQILELIRSSGVEDLSMDKIVFNFDEESILSIMKEDKEQLIEKALSESQLSIKLLSQLKEVNETAELIAKGYVNWKPDVAMQLSLGYGGSRFPLFEPNWLRKDESSFNISIGIKTTVWDGGKKVRDVSRKISETKSADINLIDARSTIRKTLNEQWNTIEVCTIKIEYQDLKVESSDFKIAQQETVFKTGYGSETDVLNAKIERCNQLIEKEKQILSRAVACLTVQYLCQ